MSNFEMDLIDTGVEWINDDSFAFVIEGNDLVHVANIGDDGTATITVFTSTHSDASILFTGTVNIFAHRTQED